LACCGAIFENFLFNAPAGGEMVLVFGSVIEGGVLWKLVGCYWGGGLVGFEACQNRGA